MNSAAPLQQTGADSQSEVRSKPRQLRLNSAAPGRETHNKFADSRPQTAIQRRLQDIAADSLQSAQLRALQRMAAASERAVQLKKMGSTASGATLQRVEDEEPLQAKFTTAQRVEEDEPLQGKFNTAQRVEEDEPLQNKLMTAQRVEDEELLQAKFLPVQRVEEDELLQGKFDTIQRQEQVTARPNNTGLPDQLKSGIESLSGMSMDHVKVHYNSSQPAQLNALAYAQGSDIHVAPGQEQHLPHEAWHVVQQAQGRVRPTMQMKEGIPANDDAGLETEADVMGAKALKIGPSQMAGNHESQNNTQLKQCRAGYFSPSTTVQLLSEKNFIAQNISYHVGGGHYRQQRVGDQMEAWIDPQAPMQGSTPDTGIGGIYLRYGGFTKGHLLNARLGGEGAEYNLFPITPSMNAIHAGVESHVKWMVMNLGTEQTIGNANALGRRVHYRVHTGGLPAGNQFTGAAHVRGCNFTVQAAYTDALGVLDDPNAPGALNTVVMDQDGSVNEELVNAGYGLDPVTHATAGYTLAALPGAPVYPAMTHNVMHAGVIVGQAALP